MGPGGKFIAVEPDRWFLCFARTSSTWWMRWLAAGKYKHVAAFGCVRVGKEILWVFYDVNYLKTQIMIASDKDALPIMEKWAEDADVMAIRPAPMASHRFRIGFWCVPAIKHLIGLRSGALRVDPLFRDCLAQGGELIDESFRRSPSLSAAAA